MNGWHKYSESCILRPLGLVPDFIPIAGHRRCDRRRAGPAVGHPPRRAGGARTALAGRPDGLPASAVRGRAHALRRRSHRGSSDPPPVEGRPVLVVALVEVAFDIVAAWTLAKGDRSSPSVVGAYRHILTDLYGFTGSVIRFGRVGAPGRARAGALGTLAHPVCLGTVNRSCSARTATRTTSSSWLPACRAESRSCRRAASSSSVHSRPTAAAPRF